MKAAYSNRIKRLELLAINQKKADAEKPHTIRMIYADGTEKTALDNLAVRIEYVKSYMDLLSLKDGTIKSLPADTVIKIYDITDGSIDDLQEASQHEYTEEENRLFWESLQQEIENTDFNRK